MVKSIKLSDYFEIIKPEYVYLKLTPMRSIRNYKSDKIAKAIASIYQNLLQCIKRYNKKYFFEVPAKVGYYVYIEKHNIEFYFIVPKNYLVLLKDKINDTWKGITVTQVASIPNFNKTAVKYKVHYKKEDALSLATDKRTNYLLSSLLNVIDVIEEGERVGVFYNFIPTQQYTWRSEYDRTIKKLNENQPIDYQKFSVAYAIKMALSLILEVSNVFFDIIGSMGKKEDEKINLTSFFPMLLQSKPMQLATKSKREANIIQTQIVVLSESKDKLRMMNNAMATCEAFKAITADNELMYKRHYGNIDFTKQKLAGIDSIKTSSEECQNFIALPAKEILETYKQIEAVETIETQVPVELRTGKICLGTNTYRGNLQKAYLTEDKEYKYLALVIIGATRAGKTTFISNISNDSVNAGECTIIFDFCGNCELSNDVSSKFPADKVLTIDCSDFDKLQGLGYNEVPIETEDVFKAYRNAKMQTSQLLALIDSINEDNKGLSAKMDRYLEAASIIVFLQCGSIKDIFGVLLDYKVRKRYIENIKPQFNDIVKEYVSYLEELNKVNKDESVENRSSYVAGIIDRVNKLKQNTYMELMLKKDCSNNFNLVDEIQKNQLICFKMPEVMFSTEREKDCYCTYWISKIWLALQIRKWNIPRERHIKTNIIVDELSQVPCCQDFIRSKLSQMAKFSGKIILSAHYLSQIGIIRNELKSANTSYMILSGSDKENYNELKSELDPYTLDDVLSLKRFHSLNLIKYEKGYAKFITKLPPPFK